LRKEYVLAALVVASLWLKFFLFDASLSPRFALTALTAAGGVGVLLCLTAPLLLLHGSVRGVALVALDALLSFLILTDEVLLRYFSDLFSFRNLGLSFQAGEVAGSVLTLLRPGDAKYFLDVQFFIAFSRFISKEEGFGRVAFRRFAAACLIVALGSACAGWKIRDYDRKVPGAIRSLWDRPAVAISTGSLVYHAADLLNVAGDCLSRKSYSEEDAQNLAEWFESRARAAGAESAGQSLDFSGAFGEAAGKNLIMIQVESLQDFVIGLRAGEAEVTPCLNALARESLRFTRAFNQTASGNSSDAEFMANVSMFPTAKGVAFMRFAGNSFFSLGSALASRGYATVALHGDRPGFWNRNHIYPALGFERFISKNEFAPGEGIGLGLSDRDFFRQAIGYLAEMKKGGRPFFAFLVTLTSHYPFNFAPIKEQVSGLSFGELGDLSELDEGLLGDYLRSIRYADEQIGSFISGLAAEGLLDESLLVIYGDHPAIPRGLAWDLGQLLGRDLSSPASWRMIQSIPILIRLPHGAMTGEHDTPAGQMDIAPTVAALMGFRFKTAFGDDLLAPELDPDRKFVVFRNGSFVKGRVWAQPGNRRAFDLSTLEPLQYGQAISEDAAAAARLLELSDMALEGDMMIPIRYQWAVYDEAERLSKPVLTPRPLGP
jgi:phosphoglycerol transferase MdoB-like AlkP superfamily enzyme